MQTVGYMLHTIWMKLNAFFYLSFILLFSVLCHLVTHPSWEFMTPVTIIQAYNSFYMDCQHCCIAYKMYSKWIQQNIKQKHNLMYISLAGCTWLFFPQASSFLQIVSQFNYVLLTQTVCGNKLCVIDNRHLVIVNILKQHFSQTSNKNDRYNTTVSLRSHIWQIWFIPLHPNLIIWMFP